MGRSFFCHLFKTTYQKDGKDHHVIKLIATSLSEVEKQKKEEAA